MNSVPFRKHHSFLLVGFMNKWIIELKFPKPLRTLKKSSVDTPFPVPKAKYIPFGIPTVLFHSSIKFVSSLFLLAERKINKQIKPKNESGGTTTPTTKPTEVGEEREMIIATIINRMKGINISGQSGTPVLRDITLNLSNSNLASLSAT